MLTRKRIYEIIEKAQDGDKSSKIFDYFILVLILLNLIAVIAGSNTDIANKYSFILEKFEIFSVTIFTIEFLLRLWTAKFTFPDKKHPYFKYMFSFIAIVDLLAILPFYFSFLINIDLRYLRILRLFRILRVLKIHRYNNSLGLIAKVLKNEKDKLIMTVFITFIMLIFASSTVYIVEHAAQPDAFQDIISTLWWAVATLTTIGYGDVYPITPLGKMLGGLIGIFSVGLIAIPSAILSSGFITEVNKNNTLSKKCPHCGKEI